MDEKKEKKQRKKKALVVRGKRKEAVARATIREGKGLVRFNGTPLKALSSPYVREIISEPLEFIEPKYDIDVTAVGGGVSGQAQAARTAIAKAIVEYSKDKGLRQRMISYDRSLIIEDIRRVEPKKFKGPKARARFTKSYR